MSSHLRTLVSYPGIGSPITADEVMCLTRLAARLIHSNLALFPNMRSQQFNGRHEFAASHMLAPPPPNSISRLNLPYHARHRLAADRARQSFPLKKDYCNSLTRVALPFMGLAWKCTPHTSPSATDCAAIWMIRLRKLLKNNLRKFLPELCAFWMNPQSIR